MKTIFTHAISSQKQKLFVTVLTALFLFAGGRANAQCSNLSLPNNLIKNPSFETNTNHWSVTNGSLYVGTGYQVCGAKNGYLSSPDNGSYSWAYTDIDNQTPGTTLSFSGYFGTHTAGQTGNPFVRIAYYGSSWTFISATTKNVTTNVDVAPYLPGLYTITSVVPANTEHIRLEVRILKDYMKIDAAAMTAAVPSTLPVKLNSFQATLAENKKAMLKWTTASEINVNNFTVERSTDGVSFADAGMVFAYGNATDIANYSFPDDLSALHADVVYYRIRTTDNDGKVQYSETRLLKLSKTTATGVSIVTYPNPVTSDIRITIPASWQNKTVVYEVYTVSGAQVIRKQTAGSSQTESVYAGNLQAGLYLVKAICGSETAQQRIVKQ